MWNTYEWGQEEWTSFDLFLHYRNDMLFNVAMVYQIFNRYSMIVCLLICTNNNKNLEISYWGNCPPGPLLTLTYLGGGGPLWPPPVVFLTVRLYHSKFRTLLSWLFSFKFPAHFDTKFVTPGGTVLKLRNFLYMHVGSKMAPKWDFVYKINANWFFSHSSHLYAYFYSQWLKWIYFSIIVLQKVSATNFTEKNNKNKRSKNKEIHKKFIKQWNT